MATQYTETLIDDITGRAGARKLTFTLEDYEYEIDLSDESISPLEEVLKTYVGSARPLRGPINGNGPVSLGTVARTAPKATATPASVPSAPSVLPAPTPRKSTPAAPDAVKAKTQAHHAAVREWAIAQGMTIAPRGRIAASVIEAYNAAQTSAPQATPVSEVPPLVSV